MHLCLWPAVYKQPTPVVLMIYRFVQEKAVLVQNVFISITVKIYSYLINTCKHHVIIPKSHLKPEGPIIKIIAHQNHTMCFENFKKYKK